ncbi:MAG TPA: SCO family protein [Thermoanaerobaculia bacterium]|nr:SCO family protein [Thermoanaerobaculia bacterium]
MNRREILGALATGAAAAAAAGGAGAAAGQPLPEDGFAAAAPLPAAAPSGQAPPAASCGAAAAGWIPNVVVTSHENRQALFYNDLVRGKTVMINFMSIAGEADNPVTANLAAVQRLLGERMGREVFLYSITDEPERDTPRALQAFAARHGAGPGWLFLTGEAAAIHALRSRLFAHGGNHHLPAAAPPVEDCSRGLVRYGNAAADLWGAAPALLDPRALADRLSWVRPRTPAAAAGPPRRRGPAPLVLALLLAAGLAAAAPEATAPASAAASSASSASSAASGAAPPVSSVPLTRPASPTIPPPAAAPAAPASAAAPPAAALAAPPPAAGSPYQHPHPQPRPCPSHQTTAGDTTTIVTGESIFPPSLPYIDPPGTNFLPTIYTNLFDGAGNEIPNTLPSTPSIAYNLLDGDPVVSQIDATSPRDDLASIFDAISRYAKEKESAGGIVTKQLALRAIQMGIDILEGNPVDYRAYSGLPLMHYDGPDKVKKVQPIVDQSGKVIGGELYVHQVWYDNHIEADTSLLDVSAVPDVPWTIVYTVDVLNRGEDDFSPYVMYSDLPPAGCKAPPPPPSCNATPPTPPTCKVPPPKSCAGPPLAGMDVTFFPMQDGTRNVFRVKMAPGKYYHLVYTWGWRMHPPRAQVMEDANTVVGCYNLVQWEVSVFGESPRSSEAAKLHAIDQISDLAPSKRMWKALREARTAAEHGDLQRLRALAREGRDAFEDWMDRTRLPRGVKLDKTTDMTLFYADNTIYGEFSDGSLRVFPQWQTRGAKYTATLYNGDYFDHGYMVVDFGGARGWENQFKSSVKDAGSGCWFTFGRNYWWPAVMPMVKVPAANPQGHDQLGMAKVDITFNWDPARRLRFYQFDPTHHDVAIFSVH